MGLAVNRLWRVTINDGHLYEVEAPFNAEAAHLAVMEWRRDEKAPSWEERAFVRKIVVECVTDDGLNVPTVTDRIAKGELLVSVCWRPQAQHHPSDPDQVRGELTALCGRSCDLVTPGGRGVPLKAPLPVCAECARRRERQS